MKVFLTCMLILSLAGMGGCSKKEQSLEDLQQPMSPEDLSRLKSAESEQAAAVPQTDAQFVTAAGTPEQLPPSGPFKPSAKEIQIALKNAGFYTGSVDGKIGEMTRNAISEFQKANGLEADGKVGPKTWLVLARYLQSAVDPRAQAVGE